MQGKVMRRQGTAEKCSGNAKRAEQSKGNAKISGAKQRSG